MSRPAPITEAEVSPADPIVDPAAPLIGVVAPLNYPGIDAEVRALIVGFARMALRTLTDLGARYRLVDPTAETPLSLDDDVHGCCCSAVATSTPRCMDTMRCSPPRRGGPALRRAHRRGDPVGTSAAASGVRNLPGRASDQRGPGRHPDPRPRSGQPPQGPRRRSDLRRRLGRRRARNPAVGHPGPHRHHGPQWPPQAVGTSRPDCASLPAAPMA